MDNDKGTRDLFLETLKNIGCQYELNEFFGAHRFVGNEMAKLREQENAAK